LWNLPFAAVVRFFGIDFHLQIAHSGDNITFAVSTAEQSMKHSNSLTSSLIEGKIINCDPVLENYIIMPQSNTVRTEQASER
jgi:hypothetical protein